MEKFLITEKSQNRITGPIMVTTSPRVSCPVACPLRKSADSDVRGGCYAEHGFLGGFIWTKLDRLELGQTFKKGQIRVHSINDLVRRIRALKEGTIWRHNQAGDLYSIDQETIDERSLNKIVEANAGRRGFTYTHYDVLENLENRRLIQDANRRGFTINLSGNDPKHATRLAALKIAPVTSILPAHASTNFKRTQNHFVVCPARTTPGVTCASCGICAKPRQAVVGFPALGKNRLAEAA